MLGRKNRDQLELFVAGSLEQLVPEDHVLARVDRVLDLGWLHERLPAHSSLTRIRQRWGETRFREIFKRTVTACLEAKIVTAEVVHIDASLIRANVSWDSLAERHGLAEC